jgi:FkbM family methyltransferase
MNKTLIYSCVFFNEKYIDLINLLLKSYKLFGNSRDNVDYLIICNPDFQKKIQAIFDNLDISGKIWCINLKTKFEAGYSRLKIFDYPNINLYNKILYLDCDILVTNSINNILDFQLENKLYALEEGNTNHNFWGKQFFDKNPNCSAFTSGILLFNNNIIIKDLFSQILLHIHNHINSMLPIPDCLDQPFIVYHAVKNNLYNNEKLINIVINNPNASDDWRPKHLKPYYTSETICHFPGGVGDYESKIVKMSNFMNNVMFNVTNKEVISEIIPHNFINTILSNGATMVSKERLINLYKQCNKFNHTNYSFVECGVAKGGCLALMKYAAGNNNKIFGFDSFEGMPEINEGKDIDKYNKYDPKFWVGKLNEEGIQPVYDNFKKLNLNFNNVNIVKGFFEDTLTDKMIEEIGKICILRLDNDWYESTKFTIEKLYDNVVDGGIILIDDYGAFIGCKRAIDEFREKNNISSQLYNTDGEEYYWIKNESIQKYIIQVGAHIGNTLNDKLFNKIDKNIIYILIEPVPYLYKQLVENYKNKSNVILLNIAISNKTEPLTLYIPSEKNNFSKLPFWASQLASVSKDHLNIHIPELIVEQISVECKTLNDIIKEYKIENLEAIYTDTEGHDYEILMDLDLDLLNALPKTIFFEHKHLDGTNSFNLNERPKYFKLLEKFKSVGYYINNQDWEDCELKLKDHNSILNNKYKWENSNIEFLENGKMNAFGVGKYRFINKYLVKCDFGGREHLLKFNQDYSKFISVRKDDFEVVVGNHL